jgi:hypothetical protein
MLPGETLATGAPVLCPDCQVEVLPLRVLHSAAGFFIGTRCDCGPVYSRESPYYQSQDLAEAALADRSFGRDGLDASSVEVYWADHVDPRPFQVTVLHEDPLAGLTGTSCLVRVFDLTVQTRTAEAACAVVFAVANSEPDALFCEARYAGDVAAYRSAGLRSLAVGDALLVSDDAGTRTAWECAPRGFVLLADIPAYHASTSPSGMPTSRA